MFSKLISTILALGTSVFTNIQGVDAAFTNGLIEQRGQRVVISSELTNCWTEEFDRILQSGQIVKITYRLELFTENGSLPESAISITHEIRYSALDETYTVHQSETDQNITSSELTHAKLFMSQLKQVDFLGVADMVNDKTYYLQTSAHLNRIMLPGMSEELNLMAYWKSIRPTFRSEPFKKADFSL